ncbi:hypothetical protein EXIGLDRAFT_737081 [Exidia glandulosa HHB12029]|uniref:Uncharacterized protein n=1 Tax=Exidia glandulosa HHB12029 TaxID=1314781 RepID=A0A166N1F4_EXIGL|nr:hypothetical protein EXIGLDRAFT_737081 [Exidia glandulosa HHB12029]
MQCLSGGLRKPVIPRQGLVNALNAACEIIDHLASATPVTPALVALARDFVKSARESQYERRLDQRELDELLGEIKSSLGDEGGDAMQVETSYASAESYRGPVEDEASVPMSVMDSGHMPPVHPPAITCYPPDHDQVYEIFTTDISVSRSPPRRTDPMAVANLLANPEPPTMQSGSYNAPGDLYNESSASLTSDLSYGLLNMYYVNDPAMDWSRPTGSDEFSPFRSASTSSIVPAFEYPGINGPHS